jgi:histidinol-phosphate aminotransferase
MSDLLSVAVPGVRGLQPYQPGKPIEELQREYGIADVIKLASNENPLGPSPRAVSAVAAVLKELNRYPDGNGFELKAALSQRLGVTPANITLGNGSNEILELVARAFVSPGDDVMFSQHAFAVYPLVTQAVGGRAVTVPAVNFGHDLEAMHGAITAQTRVIFVANPNNPTGTWMPADVLHAFLRTVPDDVIAVVDEAYFEYVEETDYPDCTQWLAEFPNLLVTRTFSKIYGLAGLRVGYGVSGTALADILNRVRQPFNLNSLALACATAALEDEAHIAASVSCNRDGMRRLEAGFRQLGLAYIPSVGNFVCVEVGDAASVYEKLLRRGVIVRPVANYGLPRHLRVTIGTQAENERFLAALAEAVRG